MANRDAAGARARRGFSGARCRATSVVLSIESLKENIDAHAIVGRRADCDRVRRAPPLAAPVLMSAEWGKDACDAWNKDPVLTDKLVESGWVKNDKGRGFKVMQVYRSDCGDKPTVEMRIALKDGKAACVYGGAPETAKLDGGADYVMKAETGAGSRWAKANTARWRR